MKILLNKSAFVVLLFTFFGQLHAQITTSSGDWTTGGNWSGGSSPALGLNNETITINHRIDLVGTLEGQMNGNSSLTINDTLVIDGDLDYENNASNHSVAISSTGVLIITGDFNPSNKVNINNFTIDGILIVEGDLNFKGGNPKGDPNAQIYAHGTVTPGFGSSKWTNGGSPGSTGVQGDFNTLVVNSPTLCALTPACLTILLPVDFVGISSAKAESGDISLQWEMSEFINPVLFSIEYSNDGSRFISLKSEQVNAQSYRDHWRYESQMELPTRNSPSYLRVCAVDFDGESICSKVIFIPQNEEERREVTSFPNPSTGLVYIETTFNTTLFMVRDMAGNKVDEIPVPADSETMVLQLEHLSAGNYILECVTQTGMVERTKIGIQ